MRKRLFEGLVATLPIASLASCGDATATTKTKETTTIETTTETKETTTATTTEVPTTTMPETTTVAPTPTTTNPVVVEPLDLSLDLSTDSFKGDKDDKTIHFYHNYGDSYTEIIDQAKEAFKETYPSWDIEYEFKGDSFVSDIMDSKVDLALLYRDDLFNIAYDSKRVVNINDYLNAKGTLNNNPIGYSSDDILDFVPAYFNEGLADNFLGSDEFGFKDGDRLSMPFVKSSDVLFMNLTALKEGGYVDESGKVKTPTTWDELFEACSIVQNYYPYSTPLGIDSESNLALNLLKQNGFDFSKDEAPYVAFNATGAAEVLEKLQPYYDNYLLATMSIYGGYTSSLLKKTPEKGGACFVIGSSSGASYYETEDFTLGISTLPGTMKNGNYNRSTLYTGYELVMFQTELQNSEERKLMTWEFTKCLEDSGFQGTFSMESGLNPTKVSTYLIPEYAQYLSSMTYQSTAAMISSFMVDDFYFTKTFKNASTYKAQLKEAVIHILNGENGKDALDRAATIEIPV
jgi:hypothetical protein